MRTRSPLLSRKAAVRALLAGLLASAIPAVSAAQSYEVPVYRGPGIAAQDLDALQNRMLRQQFQQEQQQYRQQERNTVPILRPQRQEIPRMTPSCQLPINGSPANCR
jgi:hypothetical protein